MSMFLKYRPRRPPLVLVSSVFNVFKSAIAYETSIKTLANLAQDGGEEQMVEYEFEPDTKEEVMQVHYGTSTNTIIRYHRRCSAP